MDRNTYIGMEVNIIKSLIKEKTKLLGKVYKLGSEGWNMTVLEISYLIEALDRRKLLDIVNEDR